MGDVPHIFSSGGPAAYHKMDSRRWSGYLGMLVVLTSLSSALVCAGVCVYTLRAVSELQVRLEQTQVALASQTAAKESSTPEAVSLAVQHKSVREDRYRSKRVARSRRHRGRRRSSRTRHSPGFVHLVGTSEPGDAASFTSDGSFRWQRGNGTMPDNLTDHLVGLGLELDRGQPYTIRVDASGIYHVYSQVAIHGRQSGEDSTHNDCSHVTVLTRNGEDTVLLQSHLTQHMLGATYSSTLTHTLRAFDTSLQLGTFKLRRYDRLRVRRQSHCGHIRYRSSPTTAYFGVTQLHRFGRGEAQG